MSDTTMRRVWQGWRNADFAADDGGWPRFLDELGHRFIPETWRVMTRFSLKAYVPSVLTPSSDGLPEEVAVLIYASAQAYQSHKNDPEGKAYGDMHAEVFSFEAGPSRSRTGVAVEIASPGKPLHRPDPLGKVAFESAQGRVHFLALKAEKVPDAGAIMAALKPLPGELIVLCEARYALIWLVAAEAVQQASVVQQLTPLMADLVVATWQVAAPANPLVAQGMLIGDNQSLHFQG